MAYKIKAPDASRTRDFKIFTYLYTSFTYMKTVCDLNHGSLHFLSIRRCKYNENVMFCQTN